MLNKTLGILLISISGSTLVLADSQPVKQFDDRFSIDFGYDDGKITPDAFIPYRWDKHWFSGLGFRSGSSQTNDVIDGFSDSRIGTSTEENRLKINAITYERASGITKWSVGFDLEVIDIGKLEFGYFQLPASFGGDYVAFDNEIDITVLKPNFNTDIAWSLLDHNLLMRLGLSFSPISQLDVDQTTRFKPLVPGEGAGTSSMEQDVSYAVSFESVYKTGGSINVGFLADYELLPQKYDLQVLNSSANAFITETIELEEVTIRFGLRMLFTQTLGGLYPVIGVHLESVDVTDVVKGGSNKETREYIVFGLENRF
ncbi:MAG: hypothetical protein DIZ80_17005 [endosymbiont of Galathealinum brachiosum]|uniref:Uncharacterized protein n=1 Tax=endosymbiont of Galathealinum brachiosum TaxID=2200906 RepID=A0A370D961_9GAMM|nr:MAG: hypothetical protein DIZ80_17005 [endosymbiont of Galathealinum brachiosum]